MTDPEHALERARESAAQMRAQGAYGEQLAASPPGRSATQLRAQLLEWALIEPDVGEVRSTRRFGAPVTLLKRGLLRILRQYHAELIAEQTRFNVNVVTYIQRLEARVQELEDRLEEHQGGER